MNVYDLAKLLGWVVFIGYLIAMLNFLFKFLNRNFVSKLSKQKQKFIHIYRLIMKYIVKYHKLVGIITAIFVIIHFIVMSVYVEVSITGVIAMSILVVISMLGIYGGFIKKNAKGVWLKVHRILAFSLLIAILVHVV